MPTKSKMAKLEMKKNILIVFYFIMMVLGIIQLFYWLNRKKKIVLTYHNVIPDELFDHSYHLGVSHSESVFKKQIQLIQKRFFYKKEKIARCFITLDDGYKNQLEIASKILNDYHLQGLFFIPFQSLTLGCTLTIDKVTMWLSYVPTGEYKILDHFITINNTNRHLVASKLYDKLIENYQLWDKIEEELNDAFPFDHLAVNPGLNELRFKPLTPNDLETLIKEGHLIGSHSWGHLPLACLPINEQREDFSKCIALAKKYCNSLIYSYPFGCMQEVSPITVQLCAEYGFSSAYMNVLELPGWSDVNTNYTLPRFSLPNEGNKYLLDGKLSGFEEFCKKIIKLRLVRYIKAYGT